MDKGKEEDKCRIKVWKVIVLEWSKKKKYWLFLGKGDCSIVKEFFIVVMYIEL